MGLACTSFFLTATGPVGALFACAFSMSLSASSLTAVSRAVSMA